MSDNTDTIPTQQDKKETIPQGWKTKSLGQIGTFLKGKGISKAEIVETGKPCIRYGQIYSEYNYFVEEFKSFINETSAKNSEPIFKNDLLFAGSGETLEDIGKCVAYIKEDEAYAGSDIIILRPSSEDAHYLGYLLNSDEVKKQTFRFGQGHSVVHIYSSSLKHLKVNLPPLLEQQKIAKILATWDKAIVLQQKQIIEKKQHKKAIMKKLLTGEVRFKGFKEEWKIEKLGNISKINTGRRDNQNKVENGQFPFFVRSENIERINSYSFDGEAILVPGEGRIGEIFHYVNGKFDYHQRVYKISDFDKKISAKYIYNYFQCFFSREALNNSVKATVDSLRLPAFTNMKIRFPELEEQQKIASFLEGLEIEIKSLEEKLIAIHHQKQGLMQQLLTGKVRIKN